MKITIYTSVHEAVKHGDVLELTSMVKSGASLNEVDSSKDQFTPLHWACHVGALECVHWLLWHGADATVMSNKGWTPAHVAAIRGQDACLKALINYGSSMTSQDHRGNTPALLAATHGNALSLATILRTGLDANTSNKNGWTCIHASAYHGNVGCLQLAHRWGCALEDVDSQGNTPAHYAAMEEHLSCLQYIVIHGQSVSHVLNARNDNGETPKMCAQQFCKESIVNYITNVEWERDHPDESQNKSFPAHLAAHQGDIENLRALVENGVIRLDEQDDRGCTPAHKAAGQGHVDILRYLISQGGNMDITNNAGETPKMVATRFAQLACVRLLKSLHEKDSEDDLRSLEDMDEGDVGPSEGDQPDLLNLTEEQRQEAQDRAQQRLTNLEGLLHIAKNNFRQLGGILEEDVERRKQLQEKDRLIAELQGDLDYERIKRERLEVQLDEYRREVACLTSQIEAMARRSDSFSDDMLENKRGKKIKSKKTVRMNGDMKDGTFYAKVLSSGRR